MTTAVKERPILFSGAMVRAILEDRKTQTRRVIKPVPFSGASEIIYRQRVGDDQPRWWPCHDEISRGCSDIVADAIRCPYGQPGDRLWVRETFQHAFAGETTDACVYLADAGTERWRNARDEADARAKWTWKPSIHMPRWASRLSLEVTEVRVERLQEMDRAAAFLEGCPFAVAGSQGDIAAAHLWFRDIWDSLNTKRGYGWDVNPWVWTVTFQRAS